MVFYGRFEESKHKRAGKGSATGGQFVTKGGSGISPRGRPAPLRAPLAVNVSWARAKTTGTSKLAPDERLALKHYQGTMATQGAGVNSYMRGGKERLAKAAETNKGVAREVKKLEAEIESIQSVLDQHKLVQDVTLWRVLGQDYGRKILREAEAGMLIPAVGFQSTAKIPDWHPDLAKFPVQMKITATEGTRAIDLGQLKGFSDTQQEVILGEGHYRVDKIIKEPGRAQLVLEVTFVEKQEALRPGKAPSAEDLIGPEGLKGDFPHHPDFIYHGTSSKSLKDIQAGGLKPGSHITTDPRTAMTEAEYAVEGDRFARTASKEAAGIGGDPVVIAIPRSALKGNKFKIDTEYETEEGLAAVASKKIDIAGAKTLRTDAQVEAHAAELEGSSTQPGKAPSALDEIKKVLKQREKEKDMFPVGDDADEQIFNIVDDVAKTVGFNSSKVMITDVPHYYTMQGKRYQADAVYNNETGVIELYRTALAQMPEPCIRGLVAHEMTHDKFNVVWNTYVTEDKGGPTFERMAKHWQKNIETLIEEDGVTKYSKAWWKEVQSGDQQVWTAINETLAEIASVDAAGGREKISESWRALYNDLDAAYKELGGTRKKKAA